MTIEDEKLKIEKLGEKIRRLEVQKKQLEAVTKEKSRKERTRRLIQIGAIMDSMGIDSIVTVERFKNYFIVILNQSNGWINLLKIINNNSNSNCNIF